MVDADIILECDERAYIDVFLFSEVWLERRAEELSGS